MTSVQWVYTLPLSTTEWVLLEGRPIDFSHSDIPSIPSTQGPDINYPSPFLFHKQRRTRKCRLAKRMMEYGQTPNEMIKILYESIWPRFDSSFPLIKVRTSSRDPVSFHKTSVAKKEESRTWQQVMKNLS